MNPAFLAVGLFAVFVTARRGDLSFREFDGNMLREYPAAKDFKGRWIVRFGQYCHQGLAKLAKIA